MAALPVKAAFLLWKNIPVDRVLNSGRSSFPLTHFYLGIDLSKSDYDQEISSTTGSTQLKTTFAEPVRQRWPDVKILLSIGGDPSILAKIASNEESRKAFIDLVSSLVRLSEFDGFDLRWLYPVTALEMTNFGSLLTGLREALPPPLLLTAAVFYSPYYWSSLEYPIQAIVDSCDWINVLAFDLYTPDSSPKLTGPPAPLYNPKSCELYGDNGVRAWIEARVPANKLVVGLPFFGYGWRLVNADNHEIFSPALGAAPPQMDPIPYSYSQILDFTTHGGAVHRFDPSYVTDYCYDGTTWIGYDGEDSVKTKVIYAKKKELRGYIAWLLEIHWTDLALQVTASDAWDKA